MSYRNKVVIITGCSSGIGLATFKLLVSSGFNLAIPTRNLMSLKKAIENIEYDNNNLFMSHVDLSSHAEINKFVRSAYNKFGYIDCVVNNAGIQGIAKLENLNEDEFDNVLNINLKAPLWIIKESVPYMIKTGGGRVVNISSQAGIFGEAYNTMYCASKFALVGITQSLALELAEHDILVNAICPGAIDTEMLDEAMEKFAEITGSNKEKYMSKLKNSIPLSRLGHPKEVASLVLFLLRGEATYTTGSIFGATGGATLF